MKLIFSVCQKHDQRYFDAQKVSYETLLRVCQDAVRHNRVPFNELCSIKGTVEVSVDSYIEIEKRATVTEPCRSVLFDFNVGIASVWDITDTPHLIVEVDVVPTDVKVAHVAK